MRQPSVKKVPSYGVTLLPCIMEPERLDDVWRRSNHRHAEAHLGSEGEEEVLPEELGGDGGLLLAPVTRVTFHAPICKNVVLHCTLPPRQASMVSELCKRRKMEEMLSPPTSPTLRRWGRGGERVGSRRRRGSRKERNVPNNSRSCYNNNNSRNFSLFRCTQSGMSFTVFPESGNIITTGVRNHSSIIYSMERLLETLELSNEPFELHGKVVNSTYVGRVSCGCGGRHFSACRLIRLYQESGDARVDGVSISFRSQFFPGARLRWTDGKGTVNLFNNGKYIAVGIDRGERANELHEKLCALIQKYWTISNGATQCAPHAAQFSTVLSALSEARHVFETRED